MLDCDINGSVRLYIKYTLKDIRDFCFAKTFEGILKKILLIPFIMLLAMVAVFIPISLFLFSRDPELLLIFIPKLLFAVLICGLAVSIPYLSLYLNIKRDFKKSGALQTMRIVEVSKDSLVISAENSNTTITWDELYRIQEFRRCFLIYQSSVKIFILPKRCFVSQEQLEDFRSILKSSVESNKLKLKNYKLMYSCPDYCDTEFEVKNSVLEKAVEGDSEQKPELLLEVLLEKKEYIKFNFMFFYKKPRGIIIALLGLYLLVSSLSNFGQLNNFNRIFSLISGLFFTLFIPLVLFINSIRAYNNDESLKKPVLYKIYKDHYAAEQSESFSNIEWDKLVKVVNTKDFTFLFITNNLASIIPKRIFKGREDDLLKFEGILREHCGDKLKKRF